MRISNIEVVIALAIAGLVNMAMVMMASGAFHAGHPDVAEIETAYHTLTPLLGVGAAALPGLADRLRHIELGGRHHGRPDDHAGLRRLPHSDLAAAPDHHGAGFVVVAYGVNATQALVVSQVVLSSCCRCR